MKNLDKYELDGWVGGWMGSWMAVWMDVWVDGQLGGWLDGWMVVCWMIGYFTSWLADGFMFFG